NVPAVARRSARLPPELLPTHRCSTALSGRTADGGRQRYTAADNSNGRSIRERIALPDCRVPDHRWRLSPAPPLRVAIPALPHTAPPASDLPAPGQTRSSCSVPPLRLLLRSVPIGSACSCPPAAFPDLPAVASPVLRRLACPPAAPKEDPGTDHRYHSGLRSPAPARTLAAPPSLPLDAQSVSGLVHLRNSSPAVPPGLTGNRHVATALPRHANCSSRPRSCPPLCAENDGE